MLVNFILHFFCGRLCLRSLSFGAMKQFSPLVQSRHFFWQVGRTLSKTGLIFLKTFQRSAVPEYGLSIQPVLRYLSTSTFHSVAFEPLHPVMPSRGKSRKVGERKVVEHECNPDLIQTLPHSC